MRFVSHRHGRGGVKRPREKTSQKRAQKHKKKKDTHHTHTRTRHYMPTTIHGPQNKQPQTHTKEKKIDGNTFKLAQTGRRERTGSEACNKPQRSHAKPQRGESPVGLPTTGGQHKTPGARQEKGKIGSIAAGREKNPGTSVNHP